MAHLLVCPYIDLPFARLKSQALNDFFQPDLPRQLPSHYRKGRAFHSSDSQKFTSRRIKIASKLANVTRDEEVGFDAVSTYSTVVEQEDDFIIRDRGDNVMLKLSKIQSLSFLAAVLALGASSASFAAPSLWWDHFLSSAASQEECVNQAETVFSKDNAGQITSDADSVRAWSPKTVGVAECLKFGDQLIVSILVSSDDSNAGSALFNSLRSGVAKK